MTYRTKIFCYEVKIWLWVPTGCSKSSWTDGPTDWL